MNIHRLSSLLLMSGIALLSVVFVFRSCDSNHLVVMQKGQVQVNAKSDNTENTTSGSSLQSHTPREILDRHNRAVSAFDAKVKFWGKVLDQDGQPVPSVEIKASVTTLRMVKTEKGYREFELLSTTSKGDGTFMFDGAEGFSLTIENLAKEGYVLPSAFQAGTRWESDGKYFYRYKSIGDVQAVFRPNPETPVVFHLWKLNKPEPLIILGNWRVPDILFKVPAKYKKGINLRAPAAYDPEKYGDIMDLVIELKDIGVANMPQWEIIITNEGNDGGVVKADPSDAFLFTAPESGYTKSISFQFGAEGADFSKDDAGAPVRFFVRCKNGQWHTAVESVFFVPDESGRVFSRWRHWLNPSGSRNLEHDAAHPLPEPVLSKR